jgi:hypothetical protein
MLVPPVTVNALTAGVAVPESVGNESGTVAALEIVIDPPAFATPIPVPGVNVAST